MVRSTEFLTTIHTIVGPPGLKWSGKFRQRAKMYPALTTGYGNDDETQFFGQV